MKLPQRRIAISAQAVHRKRRRYCFLVARPTRQVSRAAAVKPGCHCRKPLVVLTMAEVARTVVSRHGSTRGCGGHG